MGKRKRNATPAAKSAASEEWLETVLSLPKGKVIEHLADIANRADIKTADFKRARITLPSFSAAKWSNFANEFGVNASFENHIFDHFITPAYSLPPSFHENMFEMAWQSLDVYRERMEQKREASRIRFMDPYLVPIIALFQGRVIDKPKENMMKTEYSSGGEVEHEIFMIGGILFFIAEFKLASGIHLEDCVTQLFFEILSAAKSNEDADFADLRVYGLLTDTVYFRFFSYNPLDKTFAEDTTFVVNITRDVAFTDMIPVCNKIFGVILTAYIDGLGATLSMSREREKKGDVSSQGSAPFQQLQSKKDPSEPGPSNQVTHINKFSGRKSASRGELEIALNFAKDCRAKLEESVESVEDIEQNATDALELLAKSVRAIPRASGLTGKDEPFSLGELKELAHRMVNEKYYDMIREIFLP